MAKETVNIGTSANANNGDPLRTAFTKINNNFTELYTLVGAGSASDTLSLISPLFNHTAHDNVSVSVDTNNNRLILTASVDNLVISDIKGSVFSGLDSTVLVDGTNSKINLDGTVKGDIIPDTDVTYDLGSATKRFRDLYLSGSTIDLGGTTISVVGGALQVGGTNITDVVKAGLFAQGGLTETLTVGEDSQTGGLLYDSGGAQLISIQNPAGNFNTLTARANVAGGQIILEAREEINAETPTTAVGQLTLNTGTFVVGVNTGVNGKELIFTPDSLYLPVRIEHETDSNFVIRTSDYNAGDPIVNDFTFGIDGSITFPDSTVQTTAWTGSANPFDQDLNTTDNPQFNRVGLTLGEINVTAGTGFNLYTSPDGVTSHNLNFTTAGDLIIGALSVNDGAVQTDTGNTLGLYGGANVAISTDGGNYEWNFGTDGTLTVPGGSLKHDATTGFLTVEGPLTADMVPSEPGGGSYATISNGVKIRTHRIGDDRNHDWNFAWDGAVYPPHDPTNSQIGAIEWRGSTGSSQIKYTAGYTDSFRGITVPPGPIVYNYAGPGGFTIRADNGSISDKWWIFNPDGDLTIPGGIRSEGDISIDINLSDSTLRSWKFTEGGQFETNGSIILNSGGVQFPGVGTISGDSVVPSLDLEVVAGGDITLLSGDHTWKFNSDGTLKTPELVVGPAGASAPKLSTTVNVQNGVAMDLRIDAGTDGGVTGTVTVAGDSIELLGFVNADAINIGGTRLREEFIEFQGASQLSIPLDGYRSQFAIDIVNKVLVSIQAEATSGQDFLYVIPGSITFTTDFYFIDPNVSGTYYRVIGVTDLGGITRLDIPGYDFTTVGNLNDLVEFFDSATNFNPHEVRIDSAGEATGITSLSGVNNVIGTADQYLYLSTVITGGSTSSNIAMTSVGGVRNTLNGTTDFGSGATVNFANATVTNWTDPNVVNEHEGSTVLGVGVNVATIDNLTVRIVNDGSNNMDVEFNYNPTTTTQVAASGDTDNRFSGTTTLAPGNTTWTVLNSITTAGTTRTFTVTDLGAHKVYRGTIVSRSIPDGVSITGDAYCILERLM